MAQKTSKKIHKKIAKVQVFSKNAKIRDIKILSKIPFLLETKQ